MIVFIQRLVLTLHALTIQTLTAHNANKDTFYKIISVQKLIQNVLILITQRVFVKNVPIQTHKAQIAYEILNNEYFIYFKIFLY